MQNNNQSKKEKIKALTITAHQLIASCELLSRQLTALYSELDQEVVDGSDDGDDQGVVSKIETSTLDNNISVSELFEGSFLEETEEGVTEEQFKEIIKIASKPVMEPMKKERIISESKKILDAKKKCPQCKRNTLIVSIFGSICSNNHCLYHKK